MKVLRVSHDYNRNVGGLQKHLQELNAELNKQRGLEVHQVVPISRIDLRRMVREGKVQDRGGSYFDVDSQTEIHPIFVDHTPGDKIIRLNNRSVSRKYMGQMMKIFGKLNPDIVHVHNGYYRPHRDIAKVAKDKGKKVVHTWHGGKISADRLRKIHDETAGIADYNFAISNTGRLAFSDSRERKKVEIAYGVDLSRFDPVKVRKEDTNKLRRKLGIMKDDFVYFFPGRYDNQKNQSGLIEAFANVAKKDSKTKLVLAGQRFDGGHGKGYMDRLTKLADKYGIRDKIVFNDRIESLDKLRDYYAMSDAVVYPSRNEGRGRSLVEAMAMGKPVLASGDAGLRDSIETNRGHMGLLFDPDSLESIVGSMHRVKNNPVLREDLALKAGKYARAELDIGPYAKKYFDLYRNLASAV
jgi:glycosyltransferase involved in cell wall biosynthesis